MYYTKYNFYWVGEGPAMGTVSVRLVEKRPIPGIGVVFVRFAAVKMCFSRRWRAAICQISLHPTP